MSSKSQKEKNQEAAKKSADNLRDKFIKNKEFRPRDLLNITKSITTRPKEKDYFIMRAQVLRIFGRNQLAFCDYNTALRLDRVSLIRVYPLCVRTAHARIVHA